MRDVLDTASDHRNWLVLTLAFPLRLAWRQLWRVILYMARPDIYERMEHAYEWERKRNQDLEAQMDRLSNHQDHSSDTPPDKPSQTSPSPELIEP